MEQESVSSMEPRPQDQSDLTELEQAILCGKLDTLEHTYGIAPERLIDLYGPDVLNPSRPESAAIDRWLALCDALTTTDKSMVALVDTRTPSYHACYPSDVPGSDRPILNMIIITAPRDAYISFNREPNTTSAALYATGYRMRQPHPATPVQPHFDDLTAAPRELDPTIIAERTIRLSGVDGSTPNDRLEIIVTGNSYRELYDAILSHYYSDHAYKPLSSIELDPCMIRLLKANLHMLKQHKAPTQPTD